MSRLDELIQEYCPDGVDYKPLKDLASIDIGKFVRSDKQGDEKPYPVFNGGRRNTGMYDEYNHDGDYILISARGANAGYTNYFSGKYWAGNSCYSVAINPSIINYRFAYYVIKNSEQAFLGKQQTGSIPAVSKVQVSNLLIPVPPFPVQEEIVRILDTFTELTAELTAELAARKKQYEYYQYELLTFDENTPLMPLKNITNVFRGEYITQKNTTPGKIPVILGGQEPAYYINRSNHVGEIVAIARSGVSAGFVSYWNEPIFITDGFGYEAKIDTIKPKYLYYALKRLENNLNAMKRGAGVPHVSGEALGNVLLPVPPIDVQERCIKILDNFNDICTDISSGLPAEIEARQKQYEYYRDQLLTFKELK